MRQEEFAKLKPGDRLFYNGALFDVHSVEKYWNSYTGDDDVHTVTNKNGETIKIGDPWLERVTLITKGEVTDNGDVIDPATGEITYEAPKAANMVRIEFVIEGIPSDSGKWAFLEEALNDAIESYGGDVIEYGIRSE